MEGRRDSRTDEQREADENRERNWHRERQEAGLPPVNYALVLNLTISDVTDEEAKRIESMILEAATLAAASCSTDRDSRKPSWAGSSSTVERSIFAADPNKLH
jgi:hypothetical protein